MHTTEENQFSEHEKWRQKRREEWSIYKGDYITNDMIYKFQQITGLDNDIVGFDEPLELQLWIDTIVDKLINRYRSVKKNLSTEENKYTTILIMIGFKKDFIQNYTIFDDELSSHFDINEIIEIIIDGIFENYLI